MNKLHHQLPLLSILILPYSFKGTHPAQTMFQYVEQQWLAITVLYVFLLRNVIKKRNRLFPKFSRDSVCLKIAYRKRKVYLKTAYRKRKVYLKSAYRKRNLLSNIVPEKNLVLKYCYPQNILIKSHEISWGTFGSIALVTLITLVTPFHNRREEKTQFFWVPIFESHFLFRYNI